MADWRFNITDQGRTDFKSLDTEVRQRVSEKLKWFAENFADITPIPLSGKLRGFFKLRVGDWRVVYEMDYKERIITVHAIDSRDKIYKK